MPCGGTFSTDGMAPLGATGRQQACCLTFRNLEAKLSGLDLVSILGLYPQQDGRALKMSFPTMSFVTLTLHFSVRGVLWTLSATADAFVGNRSRARESCFSHWEASPLDGSHDALPLQKSAKYVIEGPIATRRPVANVKDF